MTAPITVLRDTHPLPVLDACKWEKLEGDPHTVNLNAYTSEDGSKIMGTWICTPGKWRVDYVKWEYCHFQEGYCIITPDGMEPIHLRAGDIFVVEPGMKGTWEVVETVRKYFVFDCNKKQRDHPTLSLGKTALYIPQSLDPGRNMW